MMLGIGMALILLGGGAARAFARHGPIAERLFQIGVISGTALALWAGVARLGVASGSGGEPPAGAAFGVDLLSAWFLVIALGAGSASALFGIRYLRDTASPSRTATTHALLAVLLVAMTGVFTARTVVAFLVSWEIMALSAYFLILFEREDPGVRRAALLYLVMTHTSTLALTGMFAAWSPEGPAVSFAALSAADRVPAGSVFLLGLVGFGIKAGMVPFHFWLPSAHAAAPSPVSAVMSGVMIKTGIYGLLRLLLLAGSPPAWWGWTILVLGLASAVFGVLWALAQHDMKRLLAYHSVENIGIILLGIGLGALGGIYHRPVVAALGILGALLHTMNHALFKSLLFLGAGVVARWAGTREINRLGGAVRWLPRTGITFLIGSAAIVGLPPLNGFLSEWVVYLGLLHAGAAADGLRLASVLTAGLAVTGALALACFSKLYGMVFLGTWRGSAAPPRTAGAERGLVGPQLVLAGACIAIGLVPGVAIAAGTRVTTQFFADASLGSAMSPVPPWSVVGMSAALVLAVAAAWVWRRLGGRLGVTASGPTWACAAVPSARAQYTASSYASFLLSAFRPLTAAPTTHGGGHQPWDFVDDGVVRPLWHRVRGSIGRLQALQSGRLRWYLGYLILCLVGLLVYLQSVAIR